MDFEIFNKLWGIDKDLIEQGEKIFLELLQDFNKIDVLGGKNQLRVINYFQTHGLSQEHFCGTTGYGYGDVGRAFLNETMANIMQTESALVSSYWVSGTHAISDCLFAMLEPGDLMLSAAGTPYETLTKVIEKWKTKEFGIEFKEVKLEESTDKEAPELDLELLKKELTKKPKVLFVQKSKGYSWRKTLTKDDIKKVVELTRKISPSTYIFVDNCYGEFVEEKEPGAFGVDLIAGSLIKNPGGGLAPTGGYAAGKKELIDLVAEELTAPGLGADMGATLNTNREIIQGIYFAPKVVSEALKGVLFNAKLFKSYGYEVLPGPNDKRGDIIQAIKFGDEKELLAFVKGVQRAGAVDSNVTPVPEQMPGYDSQVVMAAGTFIQGASSELSADAPIKPPYIGFFQGGLTHFHSILGSLLGLQFLRYH